MNAQPYDDYAADLAEELELRDVPREAVEPIVREMSSHVVESGEDPVVSFGQVKRYADEFAPRSWMRRFLVPIVILAALLGAGAGLLILSGVVGLISPSAELWGLTPVNRLTIGFVLFASFLILLVVMGIDSRRRATSWRL